MNERAVVELIGTIYDAAYDTSRWSDYLTSLRARTGATSACLIGFDFAAGGEQFGEMVGAPPDMYETYEQHYWRYDEFALADTRLNFVAGHVWNSAHVLPDAQMAAGEYYNDFLRPLDLFYFVGGTLAKSQRRFVWTGVLRSRKRGPADAETMRLLEVVMPHVRQARRINERMAQLEGECAVGGGLIESLSYGLAALDTDGRVLVLNRTAETIVAAGAGVRFGDQGLAGLRPNDDARLQTAIADAVAGTSTTLTLARPSDPQPLRVIVAPVPRTVAFTRFAPPTPAVLLFLHDPALSPVPSAELMRGLYGLTVRESQLAVLLASGTNLAQAAAALGVSADTASSHLKRVFRKTGVRRQAELVALLAGVPRVARADSTDG